MPTLHPYEARLLEPYAEPERLVKELAVMCDGALAGHASAHIARQVGRVEARRTAVLAPTPQRS